MPSTFTAFVDEAGDEGFALAEGSSRWFTLSAVIVRTANEMSVVRLIDAVRGTLGRTDRNPLHFKKLRHHSRLALVSQIGNASLCWMTVLCDKSAIAEPASFQKSHRLYFYSARYLLERVSWYCRDAKKLEDAGNGTVRVVFSNRGSMSYDEFRDYMHRLKNESDYFNCKIDWKTLDVDAICARKDDQMLGLQIADAVASSCFHACEPLKGFSEPRYVEQLLPRVYAYAGRKRLRYGLKFWPAPAEQAVESDTTGLFDWTRK